MPTEPSQTLPSKVPATAPPPPPPLSPLATATQTPAHSVFLGMVEQIWSDHSEQMLTIRSIFLYLDRSYVIQTPSVRSIWDNGLDVRDRTGKCV